MSPDIEHRYLPRQWPLTVGAFVLVATLSLQISSAHAEPVRREQIIPVLGVTTGESRTGTVAYLAVCFEERTDRSGLRLSFNNAPGRFSQIAQSTIEQAIHHAARALRLSTDSWSVTLSVPYYGVTISGESLSAMVALSVAALSQGHAVPARSVMTGTITPEGSIGPVGAVSLKLLVAGQAKMRKVLVPAQYNGEDSNWRTPSHMRISPVSSVAEAFETLMEPSSISLDE